MLGTSSWKLQSRRRQPWDDRVVGQDKSLEEMGEQWRFRERKHFDTSALSQPPEWRPCGRKIEEPYAEEVPSSKKVGYPKPTRKELGPTGPARVPGAGLETFESNNYMTVEKEMGMKRCAVDENEGIFAYRKTGKDIDFEKVMCRKIRVSTLLERRNGVAEANPGDKGYGTSEHAPDYRIKDEFLNTWCGKLSKMDQSWSQSTSDKNLDKFGRPMSEHIQLYCCTSWRKISLYVHRFAKVQEILDQVGEGGAEACVVMFKNKVVDPNETLDKVGICARSLVRITSVQPVPAPRAAYSDKIKKSKMQEEVDTVVALNDWKLPDLSSEQQQFLQQQQPQPQQQQKGKKK